MAEAEVLHKICMGWNGGWPKLLVDRYHGKSQNRRASDVFDRVVRRCKYLTQDEVEALSDALAMKYTTRGTFRYRSPIGAWFREIGEPYRCVGDAYSIPETAIRYVNTLASVASEIIRRSDDMKTTGELRARLAECFEQAASGNLSGDALRGVIGCANQINTSLAVEIKARAQLAREGVSCSALGDLPLSAEKAPTGNKGQKS
jgi:hypothetical protein